jgi:hypothetical protein
MVKRAADGIIFDLNRLISKGINAFSIAHFGLTV